MVSVIYVGHLSAQQALSDGVYGSAHSENAKLLICYNVPYGKRNYTRIILVPGLASLFFPPNTHPSAWMFQTCEPLHILTAINIFMQNSDDEVDQITIVKGRKTKKSRLK